MACLPYLSLITNISGGKQLKCCSGSKFHCPTYNLREAAQYLQNAPMPQRAQKSAKPSLCVSLTSSKTTACHLSQRHRHTVYNHQMMGCWEDNISSFSRAVSEKLLKSLHHMGRGMDQILQGWREVLQQHFGYVCVVGSTLVTNVFPPPQVSFRFAGTASGSSSNCVGSLATILHFPQCLRSGIIPQQLENIWRKLCKVVFFF